MIMVSCTQHPLTSDKPAKQITMSNMPRGTSFNAKRKGTSKKMASNHSYSVTSEEEKLKQQHFKAISLVFEECAGRFKLIRERINAMSLERMQPKSKTKRAKSVSVPQPIANPFVANLEGKLVNHIFSFKLEGSQNLQDFKVVSQES